MAEVSHLSAETGEFTLRAHLELCFRRFYANALKPTHQRRHLCMVVGSCISRPNGVTTNGGRPLRPHSPLTFSSRWRSTGRPYSWSSCIFNKITDFFLSSTPAFTFSFHLRKDRPLRISVSILHSLLVRVGIEPHPGPFHDPCSVCGSWVPAGWVPFLSKHIY